MLFSDVGEIESEEDGVGEERARTGWGFIRVHNSALGNWR